MNSTFDKILEVQKASWNKSSYGWKKWDDTVMHFLQPVGDTMISMLHIQDGDNILDVATGTGEPGLTMASRFPQSKITGTDLSEEMLVVARENGSSRKLGNFETVCCDASDLPFPENYFDAITCRCGHMFFPDMEGAMDELMRVLKPGGRISAAVWSKPELNPWISTAMQVIISKMNLSQPAPGNPGLFRCAPDGYMHDLFIKSRLKDITEVHVKGQLDCTSADMYWNFISDCASPAAFKSASDEIKKEIKNLAFEKIGINNPEEKISLGSNAIVISGSK